MLNLSIDQTFIQWKLSLSVTVKMCKAVVPSDLPHRLAKMISVSNIQPWNWLLKKVQNQSTLLLCNHNF